MQLSYRSLFTDANNIEYSVVKTHGANCLCLQGDLKSLKRLKKSYLSSVYFYECAPENTFEALSVNQDVKNSISTALFAYRDCGFLSDYLKVVSKEQQYAAGKKLGRALSMIHSRPLLTKHQKKAALRHGTYLEHLALYMTDYPHFENDNFAIDAISMRYDKLKIYRSVMRYGSLKHDKVLMTRNDEVMLLPSYSYGPGDMCEDFASLEVESAGLYPVFCAGVIDGYFKSVVPSAFWMHFAMYSALYALWKCGQKAFKDPDKFSAMQTNFNRILKDFDRFTRPIPKWYTSDELREIRSNSLKLGL